MYFAEIARCGVLSSSTRSVSRRAPITGSQKNKWTPLKLRELRVADGQ